MNSEKLMWPKSATRFGKKLPKSVTRFNLTSRQDIRKFEEVKSVKKFREDEVSKTIEDFFVLNEDGVTWRFNE